MSKFFISLYRYFRGRKVLLYSLLLFCVAIMAFFAVQVRFDEDVTSFFPDGKDDHTTAIVFKNLKVKDKILVLFSAKDSLNADPDMLIEAANSFVEQLKGADADHLIKRITTSIDGDGVSQTSKYIFDNLPVLLTESDYNRLDSVTASPAIAARMQANYNNLISPMGIALKDIILKDPLGLSGKLFAGLQSFGNAASYNIYEGYIFSEDLSQMVIMIDPTFGAGSTGKNDKLVKSIEEVAQHISTAKPVTVEPFGGPMIAVYNARQIKQDTMITLTIAILIIIVFITMAFRNRWAMVLITAPVLFGALFALSIIYFLTGSISAIAIGSGAAVFGIAMNYSIHMLSHRTHTVTIEQVIDELASPLTIGSFTTIGAFLGLLFTTSKLLQDFGLFAALSLVGTTIFCLVFLPHFLSEVKEEKHSKLLSFIERINSYRFDRNKWIIGFIVVLVSVCAFYYNDVKFDSDMMHLNFEPKKFTIAEQKINKLFNNTDSKVVFVSTHQNMDTALSCYADAGEKLEKLKAAGLVKNVISAYHYLIPLDEQKRRIERWNTFWTPEKRAQVMRDIVGNGVKLQFKADAFAGFEAIISASYAPRKLNTAQLEGSSLFREWASSADGLSMLLTQVSIDKASKDKVYSMFKNDQQVVILDKGYFTQKMAVSVNKDFNLILYISSLLIFIALLLSYGRIELALMSFIPMFLSWIIILGMMALLGIEFNIVNIILSTFIFGIGDDFSIFIMDGLQQEYSSGKKMLSSHKTAIFFSAFTVVVGMGVLIFARHPALRSISAISMLGMAAVVLISYTVQPILFRLLITRPTQKGGMPYTVMGIIRTIYTYTVFVVGCIVLQLQILFLFLLPVKKERRKYLFHSAVYYAARFIATAMVMFRKVRINEMKEDFREPAVVVANHQSFIDIIIMLGLSRKMLMVTNSWVWNSPVFGRIVRYADYYHAPDGYDSLVEVFKEKVSQGYSVIIFPEGTRSVDGSIKRFHKGAFYLAHKLNVDILPVVLYGNGMAISKLQPFLVKPGYVVTKILKRVRLQSDSYREYSKQVRRTIQDEYQLLCEKYSTTGHPFFYQNIIKSYTYKGPVLEWYMRVKIRMEGCYRQFDELIPRNASVVDIGCGYGPMCFMLAMVSPGRKVLGIDYDEEKITIARHSFIKQDNLRFEHANALEFAYPMADVFVMNDVLHYMSEAGQTELLNRCLASLNDNGMIIVREGDNLKTGKHKVTKLTEKLSTEIVKFNKSDEALCFTSSEFMEAFALKSNLSLTQKANDGLTSNTIYIFRKNG